LVSWDADPIALEMKASTPLQDFPESRASGSRLDNQSQKSATNHDESKKLNDKGPARRDREQVSKSKTFLWLAQEVGMDSMKFDPAFIESIFTRIEDLKYDLIK
jgi:hypothetical protein